NYRLTRTSDSVARRSESAGRLGDLVAASTAFVVHCEPGLSSRNSRWASRYRSFFQTGQVWAPESTCQMCDTFFCSRLVWKVLFASMSRAASPQDSQRRRSCSRAAAGSETSALVLPKSAEEKPPT